MGTQARGEAGGQTEWTAGQGDGAGKGGETVLGTLYGDTPEAWGWELGQDRTSRPALTYRAMGVYAALLLPNW